MIKKISFFLCALVVIGSQAFAQGGDQLPSLTVKSLEGTSVNTSEFDNKGNPIILSFWATWCKPCILELTTINDHYEDWQDETGVKLIAVSIDDARNSSKVRPFVNGKGWEYEVYLDENGDFKRAMNVTNVPHTFVLNSKKEIVYEHTSYSPGDEEHLFEEVKKNKGE